MYCDIPDFGRCCFCLPLRRGVLIFGYLNVLFAAFMVGVYSYFIHSSIMDVNDMTLLYRGVTADSVAGVCLALYCIDLIVNCVLVYGAHEKVVSCVRIYYYYEITTILAALVLQFIEFGRQPHAGRVIEMVILTFAGFCIQLYLIILVRSLLKKLETSGPHSYDNQLHMVVTGESKLENGIYNNSTVVPNNWD